MRKSKIVALLAVGLALISFNAAAIIVVDHNGEYWDCNTRINQEGVSVWECVPILLDHQPPDREP